MADLIDEIDMSLWAIVARLEAVAAEGPTAGPWMAGHLSDDGHSCNCASILSDTGIMGAVATVHRDNGLPISEGGNDAPPLSEAKANQKHIAEASPAAISVMIKALRKQARLINEMKSALSTEPKRFHMISSAPDGGEIALREHPAGAFITYEVNESFASILKQGSETFDGR